MDPKARRWLQSKIRTLYKQIPSAYCPEGKPGDLAWQAARVGYGQYKCAHCEGTFGPTEVDKDHVIPVIDPLTGDVGWETWFERLAGPIQILCKPCHKAKSESENKVRRAIRKKAKDAGKN